MGCVYMISRSIGKFRAEGGDMEWIYNGSYPKKLKPILKLARKLGRCPWEINGELIEEIIGDEENEGNTDDSLWTQKELVSLSEIIVFTQYLSTISLAMGLEP